MKRRRWLLLTLACLCLAVALLFRSSVGRPNRITRANFARINGSMTQQKIESLLGEPRNDLMTGVGAGEPGEVKRACWEHGDYAIFVGFDNAGRAIWKSFYDV